MKYNIKVFLLIVLIPFFLVSCGGGSSSTPINSSTKTGIFVDDIVEGIYYKSNSSEGFTNNKGEFSFYDEEISFYIGDIKIGSIDYLPTDKKVFIQDLLGKSRDNVTDTKVLNIASFLQSLDSNISTDKIEIKRTDFDKFKQINKNIDDINTDELLNNKGFDKKSIDDARLHLIKSYQKHNKYTFDQNEKDFLFSELNTNYYWADSVMPSNYTNFTDPNKMIKFFKNKELDKWSYAETFKDYFDSRDQEEVGYGCYFDSGKIVFLEIDSPCDKAGFKRGDFLLKINNKEISEELFTKVFDNTDVSAKFTVSRNGNEIDLYMAPSRYEYKVSKSSIINKNNKKIGYFIYDSFSGDSDLEIEESFTYFKKEDIDELIIDFRYNGGGALTIASILLDKLAGLNNEDKLQYYLKNNNSTEKEEAFFMEDANSLDLSRVVFLTSKFTASASELVINSLKPYLDVKIIGSKTSGKPVGMRGRYISSKYIYWLINFAMFNANDEGEYFNGLSVNCKVEDFIDSSRGDKKDRVINEALFYIENGSCSSFYESDNDLDGILDYNDDDDDNDGVLDNDDAFPFDKNESKDNDNDGIGDNEDNDDDNDGIEDSLDFQPFNDHCYKQNDGNGDKCYKDILENGNSYGDNIFNKDENSYLFIKKDYFNNDENLIINYDVKNSTTNNVVNIRHSFNKVLVSKSYLKDRNLLFLAYSDGLVTKINFMDKNPSEKDFIKLDNSSLKILATESYVFISYNEKLYVYNQDGLLLNTEDSLDISNDTSLVWNGENNSLFMLGRGAKNSTFLKSYIFAPTTGEVLVSNEKVSISDSETKENLLILPRSNELLLYGKYIFDGTSLSWKKTLSNDNFTILVDDNYILGAGYTIGLDNTPIYLYDNNFNVIDKHQVKGSILNIEKFNGLYKLLIEKSNKISIETWNPNISNPPLVNEIEVFKNLDCNLSCFIESIDSSNLIYNKNIIIGINTKNSEIFRFDLSKDLLIEKVKINKRISSIEYDYLNNSLYIYESGKVNKIDYSEDVLKLVEILDIGLSITEFKIIDNFIMINSNNDKRYIFTLDGELLYVNFNYSFANGINLGKTIYDKKRKTTYFKVGHYTNTLYNGELNDNGTYSNKVDFLDYTNDYRDKLELSIDNEKIFYGDKIYDIDTKLVEKTFDDVDDINIFYWDSEYFIYNKGYYINKNIDILDSSFNYLKTLKYNEEIVNVFKYLEKVFVITKVPYENKFNVHEEKL